MYEVQCFFLFGYWFQVCYCYVVYLFQYVGKVVWVYVQQSVVEFGVCYQCCCLWVLVCELCCEFGFVEWLGGFGVVLVVVGVVYLVWFEVVGDFLNLLLKIFGIEVFCVQCFWFGVGGCYYVYVVWYQFVQKGVCYVGVVGVVEFKFVDQQQFVVLESFDGLWYFQCFDQVYQVLK